MAAIHSDLMLALDELGELPARVAGQAAYMLANGTGKARARRDGKARPAATWRVLFLSTGEIGLADLIAEAGGRSRAGQEVRVIDLPADAGKGCGLFSQVDAPGRFADCLADACATHYGHAGPAFVKVLADDFAEARDGLRTARDAIAATLTPNSLLKFGCSRPTQVGQMASRSDVGACLRCHRPAFWLFFARPEAPVLR